MDLEKCSPFKVENETKSLLFFFFNFHGITLEYELEKSGKFSTSKTGLVDPGACH